MELTDFTRGYSIRRNENQADKVANVVRATLDGKLLQLGE